MTWNKSAGVEARQVVGISDFAVSNDPAATIATYALGSCVAVILHAPGARAAGLLHFMLADSALNRAKAAARPGMFADTGIPVLLEAMGRLGVRPVNLVAKLVGGGNLQGVGARLGIGTSNHRAALTALRAANVRIIGEDVGGSQSRSAFLTVGTGQVRVRSPSKEVEL